MVQEPERRKATRVTDDLVDIEMYAVPDTAEVMWPKEKVWAGIATWSMHRGKRTLCAMCIRVIHDYGQAVAPHPRVATQKRVGPNNVQLLCGPHATEMRARDDRARQQRDRRVAENAANRAAGKRR